MHHKAAYSTHLVVNKESADTRRIDVCNGKVGTDEVWNVLGQITTSLEVRLAGNYDTI